MSFELPPLPYNRDGLAPHISKETLDFHYGKHHQAYITNLNQLIDGTPLASEPLERIIAVSAKDSSKQGIFNNAAQAWNHNLYWQCMKPKDGGGQPSGELLRRIKQDFGSYDAFATEFKTKAAKLFGSGWAWLAEHDGKLKVLQTINADNPLTASAKPLLGIDVWEHSYYIDYRNARAKYIDAFLDCLVDWDFVASKL